MRSKYANLRGAITAAGYTHYEIAKRLGLGKTAFSQRISGLKPFTLDEAYGILKLLAIPDADLVIYFPKGG